MIKYAADKELEQVTLPLWLIHYLTSELSGKEHIDYSEYIGNIKGSVTTKTTENKSPEKIIEDIIPIVEHYRNTQRGDD
ncbi:MAG: hypothetical protein FWF15_05565 [Oscillospiraceae bacterium]|nr:hypothetical protein [Oscillospiraceae bacterium]